MRTYIGFSNDHSASMSNLRTAAERDFNSNVLAFREEAISNSLDVLVSVVQCGIGRPASVKPLITNASITAIKPIADYRADGSSTPLFDSVGMLIEQFKRVPDANEETTSFLIFVTTDGEENSSQRWTASSISNEIRKLQATDRWTFVFRVPRGYKNRLTSLGIPEDNILEWDVSSRGLDASTQQTQTAAKNFCSGRAQGMKGTTKFYADLSSVSVAEVKASLADITSQVTIWPISHLDDGQQIRPFVESKIGVNQMQKGSAFYQLTKAEKEVQDYKIICIREKQSGKIYSGVAARQMLGLPTSGTIKLEPGNHGRFQIFIQSTSVNRKLVGGTNLLYWPNVGQPYIADPLAPVHQNFAPTPVAQTPASTAALAIDKVIQSQAKTSGKKTPQRDSKGRFIKAA